jgi:hypothetical protein
MMLTEIVVGGPAEPWRAAGLVPAGTRAEVTGCALVIDPARTAGVVGWGIDPGERTLPDHIDGIDTWSAPVPDGSTAPDDVVGWDHVVVMTSSLERTCGAIEAATGAALKRIREAGEIRQGFHRLGGIIVEVVESPRVSADRAALWGFVWNVADLDGLARRLGDEVLSPPRPAVQPGRSIASYRAGVGLGVAVALMSPPHRR